MKELVTAQIDNVFFLRWNRNLQNENATWVDQTRVSKTHILSMALNTEHCFFFLILPTGLMKKIKSISSDLYFL